MNLSNPILICDENEDFRILLREMLTKNGFFHILETTSANETIEILKGAKKNTFVLIEARSINDELIQLLQKDNHYLVMAQPRDELTFKLAARLGVKHLMSFPFHSDKLIERIGSFISS